MAVSHPTIIRIGILLPDSGHVHPGHAHGQNLRAKAAGIRPNGRPAMKRHIIIRKASSLLLLHFRSLFPPHDDVNRHREDQHQEGQHLGHGDLCARNEERVGADALDDEPPQPVAAQVQQADFPIEALMLPEAEQQHQHQQIPGAFIQESGVDIDIIGPLRDMGRYVLGNVPGPHRLDGELHGKKAVIVFPEDLPVHEVSPAADGLPQNQSRHAGVTHQQGALLFDPSVDEQGDERGDHRPIDGHAAVPGVEDAQQIVLVIIPGEHHIIDARPDDGEDHRINGKIPVVIRILPCHLGHVCRHEDARQHAHADDQAVEGNAEAKDAEGLGHVPQIDSQVRECDIANIHTFIPFSHRLPSACGRTPCTLLAVWKPFMHYTLKRNRITSPSFTT